MTRFTSHIFPALLLAARAALHAADVTDLRCEYRENPLGIDATRPRLSWQMEVTLPANSTATVHVPSKDAASVTEGGNTIGKVEGVKFLRMEHSAAVYSVGSGAYRFHSTLSENDK